MNDIMLWFNESPVETWIMFIVLIAIMWLWNKFDTEITQYALRNWQRLPPHVKFIISMFKPNIEKLLYTVWLEIYEDVYQRVSNTPTKSDDAALAELKDFIETKIDSIDTSQPLSK